MFKVGDLIQGLPGNNCTYTDYRMTKGKVVDTYENSILILILEHSNKSLIGHKYWASDSSRKFSYCKSYRRKRDLKPVPLKG